MPDMRTRDRVLAAVSEFGPITAADLAARFGLSVPGVRRHLDALVESGDVAEREPVTDTGRRGRPARAYVLAEAGHAHLHEEYDELAASVLRFLREQGGDAAIEQFARSRADELVRRLEPALAGADGPQQRSEALAGALAADGYAASARPVSSGSSLAGVQLCQGHCPVQQVAAEFPQFCEAEREAFSQLIGVHVQRLASLAHGDHVCTTFVPLSAVAATAHPQTIEEQANPQQDERDPR